MSAPVGVHGCCSPRNPSGTPAPAPRGQAHLRQALATAGLGLTLLAVAVPARAQLFDFNAGSGAYGWTLGGAYVECNHPANCTPVPDNLTGIFWSDGTNYPTPGIGADPTDGFGAVRFDTSTFGDGIAGTGGYWYVHFISPDLSGLANWQHVHGFRVRLIANMGPGTNWANLIVRVHDLDLGQDRYFNNGNMPSITKGSWTTYTFDWSTIPTFPARYTVKNVYVNIAGHLDQAYTAGSIWIDDVQGFSDTTNPAVTITSPTSSPTLSTTAATIDLGGTASDAGGSVVTRVTWSSATGSGVPTGSGTASGTTTWSVGGIALVAGANVVTISALDTAQNIGTDQITVNLVPPGAFNKSAPANGATGVATNPTLSWGTSTGATSYAYCYDTTNDNACTTWTSTGTTTSASLGGLSPGTTYYWHVRAAGAGGTTYSNGSATAFWSFTVQAVPGAFNKSSPANAATGVATNPTLSWGASAGATSYAYCYDTTNDNACTTWTSTGTTTSASLSGLSPGTTYYWHARAVNAVGTTYANGSATAFWSFTVQAVPGAFNKSAPANGATGVATNPTLSWGTSTGASSYAYCYDTTNDNACTTWTSTGTTTSASLSGLSPGTTYYWHARAVNAVGTTYANGSATAFWSFTVQAAPGAFNKSAPANGATGVATNPTLSWGTSTGAASYAYCYDTTNDNACTTWTSTGTTTSASLSGLSPGTTYYWHARAVNAVGTTYANGSATAFWSFTAQAVPGAFNKSSPANAATGVATNPTLSWGASAGATSYAYCYDTTNDNACTTWTSTGTTRSVSLSGLSPGTTYYWQVRASPGPTYANGSATAFWRFTVQPAQLPRVTAGRPSLSGDGRYLAFVSPLTDLVAGDTNGQPDIFVRDTTTGATVRVSVSTEGAQADGPSDRPRVSGDGRYVAFVSSATNLVPGDTNGADDVFLHDRDADGDGVFDEAGGTRTLRVSVSSSGAQADADSGAPDLSPDGLWVAFQSAAANLAPGDNNGALDVFVHHWPSGQTLLVSGRAGVPGNGDSLAPAVSARADVVVFASDATNLADGDTNGVRDVFRWERETRQIVRLTGAVDANRPQANGASDRPAISDDGRIVAFQTLATNLSSAPDANGTWDVIVLRPTPPVMPQALKTTVPRGATRAGVVNLVELLRQLASGTPGGQAGNGASTDPAVSGDGETVAFGSAADNLAGPGVDTDDETDVYLFGSGDDHPSLVQGAGTDSASVPALSDDGRYVAYETVTTPAPGDPPPAPSVVVSGPALLVTTLEQAWAPLDGGTELVLIGSGFAADTTVTFGSTPALNVSRESGTRVVATVPSAFAPGPVDLVVTSAGETQRLAHAFTYLADADVPDGDRDGDGLPDVWEARYGLDATSAGAHDGAGGDPDGDGRTNTAEYQAGTHPTAVFTRYFAEGATAPLFETEIHLANPDTSAAKVLLRFQRADGTEQPVFLEVPARASRSVRVGEMPDMASREFSTVVESDRVVIADRQMLWDRPTVYGAHVETAVPAPAVTWYLAEGATHSDFDLFYLLQNPNPVPARVKVRFLRRAPEPPLEKTLVLAPTSRRNIWVDYEEFPGEAVLRALSDAEVSAVVTSLDGVPIIVERAMYRTAIGQPLFAAGHNSAGVTAPSTQWFLAEGSTQGHLFDLFILIANPTEDAASVEARYLLHDGTVVVKQHDVDANSRFNIWVNYEDDRLADAAISTIVTSTNGVPIIVERAMWWPGTGWYEGHNAPGTTATGVSWALAAGQVTSSPGEAVDTYVLVANTSDYDGQVAVTLLFDDGTAPETQVYDVKASSRFTVNVRADFPKAVGRRFGAVVDALGTTPIQIVVELATYRDSRGVPWAAGGNSVATRLR